MSCIFCKLVTLIRRQFKRKRIYSDDEINCYYASLVKCAGLDIQVANILNSQKDKNYAPIIYHLQQGVEKLTKAEMILRKAISIDELKEINHKTPQAFMLELNKAIKQSKVGSFIKELVSTSELKEAEKLIKKQNKIINSSEQELNGLLTFYDAQKEQGITNQLYKDAKKELSPELLNNYSQERTDNYMNLFFLSWCTFPHAELTRYPNKKINPWEYNSDKGIVQVIPLILKKTKESLNYMKENINYNQKNNK